MKRFRKSRLPILALLALLTGVPAPSDASDDKPETLTVRNASVCNESTLRFVVDRDTNEVWLRRAGTKLWKLDQHLLTVGYGTSLQQITYEFEVVQPSAWTLEVFSPDDEIPDLHGPDATGRLDFTIARPTVLFSEGYEVTVIPTPLGDPPITPATLPDVVIEPQTGCPEDDLVIVPNE